jgi:hypothetical protein
LVRGANSEDASASVVRSSMYGAAVNEE